MAHIEKFKAPALGNMCAHYDRSAELERGVSRDNIDHERTRLNYNLRPHEEGLSQVQFINDRIGSLGLKRSPRKDAVRMCDCVVTMPKVYGGDQREFFEAVCHTLDDLFGGDNCVSAWVHLDEMTPHVHYAFVPVTDDGRLSAKDKLNRAFMQRFHARLEDGVSHLLGVERVGLLLTDEEREERGGRYVDLNEFKDAKAQVDKAEARLECLQGQIAELEPLAQGIGESAGTLIKAHGDGGREKELREEIEQLRGRVSHLERQAGDLGGRVRAAERRRADLEERVRGLISRLDWVPDGVSHLARGIAHELGKRVTSAFERAADLARIASRAMEMPTRAAESRFKAR